MSATFQATALLPTLLYFFREEVQRKSPFAAKPSETNYATHFGP